MLISSEVERNLDTDQDGDRLAVKHRWREAPLGNSARGVLVEIIVEGAQNTNVSREAVFIYDEIQNRDAFDARGSCGLGVFGINARDDVWC